MKNIIHEDIPYTESLYTQSRTYVNYVIKLKTLSVRNRYTLVQSILQIYFNSRYNVVKKHLIPQSYNLVNTRNLWAVTDLKHT